MNRRLLSIFVACFALSLAWARHPARADEPMVPLPGSHPGHFDFRNRQPVPQNMDLRRVILFFAKKHRAEYEIWGRQVQDPSSSHYHHWLSREEEHRRFDETRGEFDAVEQWLRSQGFKIPAASYGGTSDYIQFTGTAAQAEATFHVSIVWATPGRYANSTDALIPARFKDVIGSIVGLDNFGDGFHMPIQRGDALSHFPHSGKNAFAPADFYTFYGEHALLDAGINGTGTKCIALIEYSDFRDGAVDNFDSTFGIIAPNPDPIPRVTSSDIGFYNEIQNTESEALLDIEWAHAVAPGTPLKVYVEDPRSYPNTDQAILTGLTNAVTDNTCGVIVLSYGSCNHSLVKSSFDAQFFQAAENGQTVIVAAGDFGAAWLTEKPDGSCGVVASTRNVSELAADPNVLSCGGTQFTPGYDLSGNDIGFVPEFVNLSVHRRELPGVGPAENFPNLFGKPALMCHRRPTGTYPT